MVELIAEPMPQEQVNEEDSEFQEPDLAAFDGVRRGGIAPSLAAAMEKWDGMFQRQSPLSCWKVQFKTTRKASHGDRNLPEGFPSLEKFFDKCKRMDVMIWALQVHEKLRDHYRKAEVWDQLNNPLLSLYHHVKKEAHMSGVRIVQIKNPEYYRPSGRGGMSSAPKRPGLLKAPRPVQAPVYNTSVPETIERKWHMNRFQKSIIRMLMQRYSWYVADQQGQEPILRQEYTRWRMCAKSKAVGKLCLWLKKTRAERSRKRPRQEDQGAEPRDQLSPSLRAGSE